jgi:hypothetical protein
MLFAGMIVLVLTCIPKEELSENQLMLHKEQTLPSILAENSGIIIYNNLIWFINDSGNDPVVYGYDRSRNEIVRSVAIRNTNNIDWEDITQNEDFIFIGDFGNNMGNRQNLGIIKIRKTDLDQDTDTIAPVGIIKFSFEDQTDFSSTIKNNTSFDCESFIATHDHLILFTKDWLGYKTRMYRLPLIPGTYSAEFMAQWEVESLITSAAWSSDTRKLYLMGYILAPILWIFNDFDPEDGTFSDSQKTSFNNFGVQTEGILITDDGNILISSESQSENAALYSLRNKAN